VNDDGNGSTTGSGIVDTDNSPFSITATPNTGYEFSNWSGNIGTVASLSSNSTTVATSVDETITANFSLASLVVEVETDPEKKAEICAAMRLGKEIGNGYFSSQGGECNFLDCPPGYTDASGEAAGACAAVDSCCG